MTAFGDHARVGKLLLTALLALAVATSASAKSIASPIGSLPKGWSHAQLNVLIKHQPHTLTYDRGRVLSVTATSVTVREPGTSVTIPVGPSTQITIAGKPSLLSQVRPLEIATTMSIDGAAASFVRVQIPPALAARLARQAARAAKIAARQGNGGA